MRLGDPSPRCSPGLPGKGSLCPRRAPSVLFVFWVASVPTVLGAQASGDTPPERSTERAELLTARHADPVNPDAAADISDAFSTRAHLQVFQIEDRYPSANACATCHPNHYREWSVSPHAYSQMSPVFNAFHGTVLQITNGTNGDFCIRCHTPVGMNLGEPEFMTNMDRHPTSREGVTCVVCHRLDRPFGKVSGRLAIEEGSIFDPVFGPTGNAELTRVIASPDYRVNTDRSAAGRAIHTDAEVLPQISTSGFCGTCHDVNLVNGFRLVEPETDEERWLVDFDFTIQYQPSGHKDVFLRRLTEIAYRTAPGGGTGGDLLASLTDSQSPGRCAKCHSIAPASPGDEQSLWREGVLSRAPAPLTTFDHAPHLVRECALCHQDAPEGGRFQAVPRQTCVTCHMSGMATQSCLNCHSYHEDRFRMSADHLVTPVLGRDSVGGTPGP